MGDLTLWWKISGWFYERIVFILPKRLVFEVVHAYFAEKGDILGVDDYMTLTLHQAWVAQEVINEN